MSVNTYTHGSRKSSLARRALGAMTVAAVAASGLGSSYLLLPRHLSSAAPHRPRPVRVCCGAGPGAVLHLG